jgi:hypothetical protein
MIVKNQMESIIIKVICRQYAHRHLLGANFFSNQTAPHRTESNPIELNRNDLMRFGSVEFDS